MAAVHTVLAEHKIDLRAVRQLASIDVKKDEQGLLLAAEALQLPAVFYSAEQLNGLAGDFSESEFVRKTVGTGNVCERAAACGGGKLIVKKTAMDGVTVAVAEQQREITF